MKQLTTLQSTSQFQVTEIRELDLKNQYQFHEKYNDDSQKANLKGQSLSRYYQLKLQKQKEYFQLKEFMFIERIKQLQCRMLDMEQAKKKPLQQCCNCENVQMISHYKKIIQDLEQTHSQCLQNQKTNSFLNQQLQSKIQFLEINNQTILLQNNRLKNKIQSFNQTTIKYTADQYIKPIKISENNNPQRVNSYTDRYHHQKLILDKCLKNAQTKNHPKQYLKNIGNQRKSQTKHRKNLNHTYQYQFNQDQKVQKNSETYVFKYH